MQEHRVKFSAQYRKDAGVTHRVKGEGTGMIAVIMQEDGSAQYKALGRVNEPMALSAMFEMVTQRYDHISGEHAEYERELLIEAVEDTVYGIRRWLLEKTGHQDAGEDGQGNPFLLEDDNTAYVAQDGEQNEADEGQD